MSDIVTTFDPSTMDSTSFAAPQSSANGALVFWNESNNSLELTFGDGATMYLPAWYHRHKCGATGNVNVTWGIHATLSSASPPVSEVLVEAYDAGEKFPADGPLVRQTNIGNDVNTNVTSTNGIDNEGNPVGTSIIKSIVSGDASTAISWTNDAILINGDAAHPGTVSLDNGTITTDGSGNLAAKQITSGAIVAQSTLAVTGASTLTGAVIATNAANTIAASSLQGGANLPLGQLGVSGAGDILDASGNAVYLKAASSIHLQIPNGTDVAILDNSGTLTLTKVAFHTGGIKDLNQGTISASGTVNHGLSGSPSAVLMTPSSGSSTWTFGASSYTSTQFTATLNSALTTRWVAYR